MSCKQTCINLKSIHGMSGVNSPNVDHGKQRMRFFMTLMTTTMKTMFQTNPNQLIYVCAEDFLLQLGDFFDFEQKQITTTNPFRTSLNIALDRNLGVCEGFVLPWRDGIPEMHAWVVDQQNEKIFSSKTGVHFGVAFNPIFVNNRYKKTGILRLLDPKNNFHSTISTTGLPPEAFFNPET